MRIAMLLAVMIAVATLSAAALAARGAGPPVAQGAGKALRFEYDCGSVPWPCTGARLQRRWQLWTVTCPASGCVWKWLKRAESMTTADIVGGGYYRLFFGYDNDYDNIADFFLEDNPAANSIYLDVIYQCTRYPYICDPEKGAWQLYRCLRRADGTCDWSWDVELVGNMTGIYDVLELDDYLIYWGQPRGRPATPTPEPSPTVTRTPTSTRTATATRSPTREPSQTPDPSPTARPTATRTIAPPAPVQRFRLYLPRSLAGQ